MKLLWEEHIDLVCNADLRTRGEVVGFILNTNVEKAIDFYRKADFYRKVQGKQKKSLSAR